MLDDLLRNNAVQTVIQAIINFRLYLYLFAALGALIALRALLRARKARARAMFGLEREAAARDVSSALFALLLMALLAGGVYGLATYATPEAIAQRADARAHAVATATAQARQTAVVVQATNVARTPSPTPPPPTQTPIPQPTDTPAPPDITRSCHGEGDPLQMRYVDRQGVNLRRSPEFRNDNILTTLQFSNEVCVYSEEQSGTDVWLKVTVKDIEGYAYILKSLTRP